MTILILVGMAVLVGVLLLYVFELGRSRRLLLKAGNAGKHYAVPKNCFVLLCKMSMLLFF